MTRSIPLLTSRAGITHRLREEADGSLHLDSQADVTAILERNKAMATHNDGYSPSREMRRVASLPLALVLKWKQEEGWDALDPRHADRLKKKLNDLDYLWLRTAPGRV